MARTLKDAFYDSQYRVGQGIYTRAVSQGDNSLTEANFTGYETLSAVGNDSAAMSEFAASSLCMNDIVDSSVGMNTISGIQTAMDAVAASQTARDVIGFSGLAYDTIAASNMAIGKYAIGYTTESPADYADMDAVAASQTAMDAVAASQTAMDAVAASIIGRTKLLLSQFVLGSVWESVNSQIYLNEGTINVDSSFGGNGIQILQGGSTVDSGASRTTVSVTRNNDAYAIIGDPDGSGSGSARWTLKHDLSNVTTLKMQIGQSTSTITDIAVEIDGSEVASFSPTSSSGGEEVSVDLSTQSGESDLTIRFDDTTNNPEEFGEVSQVRFE